MLTRVQHASGALVLRSPLLDAAGVPHAFATRIGGVSAAPYDTLNFGSPNDLPQTERDPAANIAENYRRLLAAASLAGRALIEVHQVHGCDAFDATADAHPAGETPKADAIFSTSPDHALAIRTADCAPVLIASADGRAVAAVHAGWRGTILRVIPTAIVGLRERTNQPPIAAIGPCIGPDHFEVGPEVVDEFRRAFGETAPVIEHRNPEARRAGKAHIDLRAALAIQLRAAGIDRIDIDNHCTVRDHDLFFSHRRDQARTGRMTSVIGVLAH